MATTVITFDKSLQQRLVEFKEVLCSRGKSIPPSRILNEWRSYVELILEPTGWQALWKVSRKKCEELTIAFPTIILVEVEDVNFVDLVAMVKIIAIQDNINIPANDEVPLHHLYPTKQQKISHLDIKGTADCLDQLRFFYTHVWHPWDIDEGDTGDWVDEHLEIRLQLHYDLRAGVVQRETGEHICGLIEEGRKIQCDIDSLLAENNDDEDMNEDMARSLVQLELRKEQIRSEVRMLENPFMRNLMTQKKVEKRRGSYGDPNEVCFVWLGGTVSEFIQGLEQTKNHVQNNTFVKSLQYLQDALTQAINGDTVLLCGGVHSVRSVGGLECGGSIRGTVSPPSATVMRAFAPSNTMLDCSPSHAIPFSIAGVTLDSRAVQTLLLVRGGLVRLTDCRLVGDPDNPTCQGVLVLSGGKLVVENCDFAGLGTAVVANKGAEVSLINCRVIECRLGFQINNEANLILSKCKVTGCKENAIRIETCYQDSPNGVSKSGSALIVNGQTNINLESTIIEGSTNDDVIMINKSDVEDLFSDDVFLSLH